MFSSIFKSFFLFLFFLCLLPSDLFGGFFHFLRPSFGTKIRHVYLTWQRDPSRTMTINIQSYKTPLELIVYYDTVPCFGKSVLYNYQVEGKREKDISIPDSRKIYHIELTDLEPGKTYYFAIGNKYRCFGSERKFRTIPDDHSPLVIVEGGDWESTPEADFLAKKAAEQNPHAIFLGGDYPSYVYGKDDFNKWDQWLDMYTRRMVTPHGHLIPMVMAIGNHEVIGGFEKTKNDVPFFFDYFRQAEGKRTYFTLPFGSRVQVFVLDSGHAAPHDGKQKKWLEKELQKAQNVPIKIALYHVPLYPSLRFAEKDVFYFSLYKLVELCDGGAAEKLFSKPSKMGRKHWLRLFDTYGITVAFEHHDQTLKRTKILKGGKEDPRGTLYLGDGGWGPEWQYPPLQGYFHSYFAMLKGKVHFFWLVKIEEEKISYMAMTPGGTIIDSFVQTLLN